MSSSKVLSVYRQAFPLSIVILLIAILATVLTLLSTACSKVVTINERAAHQTIQKYRGNIVTENTLSNTTSSMLVSTGIESEECIDEIDTCIKQLDKNIIDKNNREAFALFAELHLAKVKAISANDACQESISRPPIDPYYANATLTPAQQAQKDLQLMQCRDAFRVHAMESLKNSYAYLFYDDLQPEAAQLANNTLNNDTLNSDNQKPIYVAKDLDIQTKDVYEAASDALIKQIYSNRTDNEEIAHLPGVNYTFYVDTGLFDTKRAELDLRDTKKEYGEQVKLLNVTFEPTKSLLNTPTPDNNNDDDIEGGRKKDSDSAANTRIANIVDDNIDDNVADNIVGDIDIDPLTDFRIDDTPISVDLYVPNEPEYLQNTAEHNQRVGELYASHDLNFSDLNTISQRDGLGVSYVTLFEGRVNASVIDLLRSKGRDLNAKAPEDRIRLTGNVLSSGMVLPKGNTLDSVLNTHDFDVTLYNPHHTESVDILGKPYYLAANFSASYGLWLAENGLENVSYFSLLSKQQALTLPQLYMLEPYDPNKRIIIMIHGLASSPATWVKVTNDISNDRTLRQNYQVWQIFYPTNIPILENRYQIQKLIETAYQKNDPQGSHPASQHSVLIGHSMGGVIGRLLLSNEDLEAKVNSMSSLKEHRQLDALINTQLDEQNIKNRLHLKKLDNVDDAVFISAPFRGTDFADRWFTRALRRVIQLPVGFVQTIQGNLASIATEGELTENPLGALYLQNGASQLSDQSSFMTLTADLQMADDVTYHTIIANQDSDIYQGLQRLSADITPQTQLSAPPNIEQVKANISQSPDLSLNPDKNPLAAASDATPDQTPVIETFKDNFKDNVESTLTLNLSDGIVPYNSAHLDGAASETIISGGHGIQETPEAILTLRKILHKHLDEHPIKKVTIKK